MNNLLQLPPDLGVNSNHDGECECDQFKVKESDDGNQELDERVEGCAADECREKATSIVHKWTCHGRILHSNCIKCRCEKPTTSSDNSGGNSKKREKNPWLVATQEEFDDIAKEFTLRERMLMEGDESTFLSTTSSTEEVKSTGMSHDRLNKKLSILQRFRSQYGTPFFGNYSLEVMEEALNRRGVELEFFLMISAVDNTECGRVGHG